MFFGLLIKDIIVFHRDLLFYYGIYGAECKICQELYIGQTKNKFSVRWNSHRAKWKNLCSSKINDFKDNTDEAAMFSHYRKFHKNFLTKQFDLTDAFNVFFIEQPKFHNLDIRENFWISKLMASINIAATFLPKFK